MEGLLDNRDDSKAAKKAFKQAFVSRDDAKVKCFPLAVVVVVVVVVVVLSFFTPKEKRIVSHAHTIVS